MDWKQNKYGVWKATHSDMTLCVASNPAAGGYFWRVNDATVNGPFVNRGHTWSLEEAKARAESAAGGARCKAKVQIQAVIDALTKLKDVL